MMQTHEYKRLTVADIRDGLSVCAFTARQLAETALGLAETEGKALNCFITLCRGKALAQADAVDAQRARGEKMGPLAGVPVALKDNISYRDYPLTCGSHILDGYIPPYDATVTQRLLDAGAVVIGKTNMDEFAMGSSNENSYFGPARNPHDHALAPGGSSGGSAAAVASGIVPLAFGSDTGGSVRQPAAFCGVLGLKPTYGAVSRYGLVAFGSSLDQIGPFARDTHSLTTAYAVIAGRDPKDSTSVAHNHADYLSGLASKRPLTIGLPRECFAVGLDPVVANQVTAARVALEKHGHKFVEVSLPMSGAGVACYYIVATAEASSNLARFDGAKYGLRESGEKDLLTMYKETRGRGFGAEVKRRILLGTYVLSSGYYEAYYHKGMQIRELIRQDFERAFAQVDILLTPTTPTPAFKIGEKSDDPLAMYLSDIYTVPANLAGVAGLSVPVGKAPDGRPIGAQFLARPFDEGALFQIAHTLESEAL